MNTMKITTVARKVADTIVFERAFHEGRFIFMDSMYTDADREDIEVIESQVTRILYSSNGRKWDDVLKDILALGDRNTFLGFKLQNAVIKSCTKYGICFM